ncbi:MULTISPECIES: Na(+)/H(+) antiporter subunit F1 [Cohnella]|jgi:multicomponent Na+:H+ antiporter subunit F|uniref:Na(+)/H(+) antiporter subunit F1 n=1 Tax=Cohnella TaxID=329857 RepID=UPI00036F402E|nr:MULTISPECIES: Na(+)/H(+) antiporter subunit F1 [Cohnella]REK68188.1 MAG: Na(+)/H(+) antiporter subunit F1 [Cohnella sp.]
MIDHLLTASLAVLSLAVLGCLYRLLKGPSMADRIASLDAIGINLLAVVAVLCLLFRTQAYIDTILVIGILTFIGTTAFARYIERGVVLEDGDDEQAR